MPIAAETYRPKEYFQNTSDKKNIVVPQQEQTDREKVPGAVVDRYIKYFDRNWKKERLPEDWHTLKSMKGKHVGFSMRSQMDLIQDENNQQEVSAWTQKTKQDLLGFKLEYLSDHIVYPCKYEKSPTDPTRLENKLYGNADIEETVSTSERNGSVVRGLKEMKDFFLDENTPDGSISVMTSPVGPSGLKTDDGKDIRYPDSYFFIMQKDGDTVHNYTLKTDFSVHECREAVYQLTGKRLSPSDSLEKYVETIAKIKPGDRSATPRVEDVVGALEMVRPEYAFKPEGKPDKTFWNEVYEDIKKGEQLYNFNEKTQQMIEDFEAYCLEGNHTKEELQKAIAATILRMSKYFFDEEQKPVPASGTMHESNWVTLNKPSAGSFGMALDAAADRPGCAGGGGGSFGRAVASTSVNSIVPRAGSTQEWFSCPECSYKANGPVGNSCPGCGLTKESYVEKTGISCD